MGKVGKLEAAHLTKPTNELFLNDFGAGNASPGSGSAAALMGLLSVKLERPKCLEFS